MVEMSHLYFGDIYSRLIRLHVIIITLKTTAVNTFNFVCCHDTSPKMLGHGCVAESSGPHYGNCFGAKEEYVFIRNSVSLLHNICHAYSIFIIQLSTLCAKYKINVIFLTISLAVSPLPDIHFI